MTDKTATNEAARYIAKVVTAQNKLGYKRPARPIVQAAVGDAAEAVKVLSSLSARSSKP